MDDVEREEYVRGRRMTGGDDLSRVWVRVSSAGVMDHGGVFEGKHWLSMAEEEGFDRDAMSEESNVLVVSENTSAVTE
jgi:hypothetical protein